MNLINQQFSTFFPTVLKYGRNIIETSLTETIKDMNIKKVLLVSDKGLKQVGVVEKIKNILVEQGLDVSVYAEVEPNPSLQAVHEARDMYLQNNCQLIIGLGGGSSIDAAKGVAVGVVNPGNLNNYGRGMQPIQGPLPPTIIIPTTAGTGSEVTNVAVITDEEAKRKFVLASPYVIPTYAFIDPTMTFTLPQPHIAATGIDALVHAIESYVNNKSQPVSDALAIGAMKMIIEYLPQSYADPTNEEAKAQVLLGSTIAGMAFAMTGTALVHSLSHPMTSHFHVPHGLANAIILPKVIEFNLISDYRKYAEVSYLFNSKYRELSLKEAANKLVEELKAFTKSVDIPEDFSYLGDHITQEDLNRLTKDALNDKGTYPNNKRKATELEVYKLYCCLFPQVKKVLV
ncbi:iron-containing alcohol dehydrogenase [Ureibacillus endophyticus]|uniref:iron-containing alcohol dehydrogenase n=1 Tax=Ureibacillus endophyticus TaxID=1978490 RepID=UPI001475C8AF|nr:iron-containing alcohol dehydrogenase [Lysinibacillus endophyticus]